MTKQRKEPHAVAYSDIYSYLDEGYPVSEIAKELNISTSTVYRAVQMRGKEATKPKPEANKAKPKPKVKQPEPGCHLEFTLASADDSLDIKLRAPMGVLLGTIVMDSVGLLYRRPNQHGESRRYLTWATLDKLMLLGIVTDG